MTLGSIPRRRAAAPTVARQMALERVTSDIPRFVSFALTTKIERLGPGAFPKPLVDRRYGTPRDSQLPAERLRHLRQRQRLSSRIPCVRGLPCPAGPTANPCGRVGGHRLPVCAAAHPHRGAAALPRTDDPVHGRRRCGGTAPRGERLGDAPNALNGRLGARRHEMPTWVDQSGLRRSGSWRRSSSSLAIRFRAASDRSASRSARAASRSARAVS